MYHVFFASIIHAQRERELDEAVRVRMLLKPQDEVEADAATERRSRDGRSLTPRTRPTEG